MTARNDTDAARVVLALSDRAAYRVQRVSGNVLRLAVPAASLNAAEHLRRAGLDATASIVSGQWSIVVR
jgi:hypothetical protein